MATPRITRPATIALAIIGVLLIIVAGIYFAEPAKSLPSFFPGHQAGSSHHHTTHGIAALIVGVLAIAGAWMSLGAKPAR
jgi:uncharacterized membrane protein HdeD (DUF308 family)